MSAVTNIPTNRNPLSPLNFKMVLQKAPGVTFFLQGFSLPGLTFEGDINMPTPFVKIPIPGDHLNYSPLTISYMVDEDLKNYFEILNWIIDLSGPRDTITPPELNTPLRFNNSIPTDPLVTARSDIKIFVLSSSKNPNIEITFFDAFPVSLGELSFNTTATSVNYLETSVTFEYIKYKIVKL